MTEHEQLECLFFSNFLKVEYSNCASCPSCRMLATQYIHICITIRIVFCQNLFFLSLIKKKQVNALEITPDKQLIAAAGKSTHKYYNVNCKGKLIFFSFMKKRKEKNLHM